MKLTTLPEEKTLKRTYIHYQINPQTETLPLTKKLDFYYIGKKTGTIDVLINTFESGYAAENLENAKSMLLRLVGEINMVPDIIIVDASLGQSCLHEFYKFLNNNKNGFNKIPFIVDGSNVSPEELDIYRNLPFIDDIVFLKDYSKEQLVTKVNFWKKIKQRNNLQKNYSNVETSTSTYYNPSNLLKRIFDILISGLLLIAFSPVFIFIIVCLRFESKGPLFYISKRAGRGYKIFDFYKFRTMVEDADQKIKEISHLNQYHTTGEEEPVFIKINNDPRVTKLGTFLRTSSLDELPQLLNVLKGDMSLVGNRPLPLYEAASLTTDDWAKRFMAPAGITGLWQIKKRGKEDMSAEERISLDINYADKYNFLYDLWIMANTPSAIIQKANA